MIKNHTTYDIVDQKAEKSIRNVLYWTLIRDAFTQPQILVESPIHSIA